MILNENIKMKLIYTLILALVGSTSLYAQSDKQFSKTVFSKEISFVRTDTAHGSQSTVIEYPKFLVVIELPMIDEGGGRSTNLVQDIPKAERFLTYLKKEYNNKPIKYVLSSHWHLHSLSGITPFFNQGAILVAAKTNWEYSIKNGLFGNADTKTLEKQVMHVSRDTTILNNTNFPISVLFLNETYSNKPTQDYLFFYMPKNKCIHASCMCAMNEVDFKQMPDFMYSNRVTDLEKAIKSRKLDIEYLFKLTAEYDKDKNIYKLPVFTKSYFEEFKQRGTPRAAAEAKEVNIYKNYELSFLKLNNDTILHSLINKKIPSQLINSLVYILIKEKEFLKALQWAQVLNLYQIGEFDFMDTLGEAYYNAGDFAMAQNISNQLALLNPKFPNQFKAWELTKQTGH
jgi:hypothetical protein